MPNLSKKIYTRVSESGLSLLVIAALLFSMTSVQAVDKATFDVVSLASFTEEMNVPTTGFPEVGDREPVRIINARLSFYSSDPYQTDDTPCIPADGSDLCVLAERGIVDAVAANMLPLGTTVRLPDLEIDGVSLGNQDFTVRDRMNARYNGTNFVDIYIAVLDENGNIDRAASKAKARSLGVKYMEMHVF